MEYEALRLRNQRCFPLYAASREIINKYRPHLDALPLTYTQYIAMMVFWEDKRISAKELGKKLFLDSGTLTPVLKSLESKGFVHRFRSEKDERVLMVEITDAGMALQEKAAGVPMSVAGCVRLDSDEALQLYRLLYKVLGSLQEQ